MRTFPLNPAVMGRLAGLTPADELIAAIQRAKLRIEKNLRTLTFERGALYGQPFWMVTAAEWLEEAEADLARAEAQLAEAAS